MWIFVYCDMAEQQWCGVWDISQNPYENKVLHVQKFLNLDFEIFYVPWCWLVERQNPLWSTYVNIVKQTMDAAVASGRWSNESTILVTP